jgi:competence protein ComEC
VTVVSSELTVRAPPEGASRFSALGVARSLRALAVAAFEEEWSERRFFLWLPVCAGAGAIVWLLAATEPVGWMVAALSAVFAAGAASSRRRRALMLPLAALSAFFAGETLAGWRAARMDAPALRHPFIGELAGFVEEVDYRPRKASDDSHPSTDYGARFVLRVAEMEHVAPRATPWRLRLTIRGRPAFAAGDFIAAKARVLPPAPAALPGGYDFAREAFFVRVGGVGNLLGAAERIDPPAPAPVSLRFFAAVDRARNALALRVHEAIGGDNGAIAAAMVTGKRDFLSQEARETIRRAGIFHIVTISGVQMTLVAGIFFVGLRSALALVPRLALNWPIKKWAAAMAMLGACGYALLTGSRVGSERALTMTLILLGAALADRAALTMRNLAFAALVVIVTEPEALLGASFQLSFAAVAALVAVYEARARSRRPRDAEPPAGWRGFRGDQAGAGRSGSGLGGALLATFCATSATASFMAYDFHELSPYVLIGNPLTLAVIEVFAVPAALLGSALYPLGLDGPVWAWLGLGIKAIMRLARWIGSAPASNVALPAFAPWSIVFLTLAVLSALLWRSLVLRLTAVPLLMLGLAGAAGGEGFDLAVLPSGDGAALRDISGELTVLGRHANAFATEQWLRADADPRAKADAAGRCDRLGCMAVARSGAAVALVLEAEAFHEDCARATIIISPLTAPRACAAPIVLDRAKLAETGAVTLRFDGNVVKWRTARAPGENRPWSRTPPPRGNGVRPKPKEEADEGG